MQKLRRALRRHPLIDTLLTSRGNERACMWLEPLWGIPYNLYVPFASVYMAALGMTPVQIGLVSTVFFASQMVWALLSGVLADKLGRRLCTLIFDTLSWSVPALIWMCAQNYAWFLVAAVFNGAWRVTENSWNLLLIEETPEERLVRCYALVHIAGLVAGFVAPIPYFFVRAYTVVPTMRFLYGLTFVMMTAKFVILYFMSHETAIGKRRMEEYRGVSMLSHLLDSRHVLSKMLRDKQVMLTVGMMACFATIKSVTDTFWPLLITDKLGIAAENLSVFATLRSLLMLLSYVTLVPRLSLRRFKLPLAACFSALGGVHLMLILLPEGAFVPVLIGIAVESLCLSVLNPLTTSLQMVNVDREERARIFGLFYAMCLFVTSPFGALAGLLSDMNRAYPFCLTLALIVIALWLAMKMWKIKLSRGEAE